MRAIHQERHLRFGSFCIISPGVQCHDHRTGGCARLHWRNETRTTFEDHTNDRIETSGRDKKAMF